MTSRLSELKQAFDTLLNATTALEICNGVVSCHHYQEGKEGEPLIPTPNDIKRYETVQIIHDRNGGLNLDTIRDMYPVQVRQMFGVEGPVYQTLEISDALDAAQDELENIDATVEEIEQSHPALWEKSNVLFVASGFFGFGVFLIESLEERIEAIHRKWLETRDYVNMPHPLAPIVRAWITDQNAKRITAETERKRPAATLAMKSAARVRDIFVESAETEIAASPPPAAQLMLPTLEVKQHLPEILPLEILQGIPLQTQGRQQVSMAVRLFFEGVMMLNPKQHKGEFKQSLGELVADLHSENDRIRKRDIDRVVKGIYLLDQIRIPYVDPVGGPGRFRPIRAWNEPAHGANKDFIVKFYVEFPSDDKGGMLVIKSIIRRLGQVSPSQLNAYLAACWIFNRYGRSPKNVLIDPTMPDPNSARDERGVLLHPETHHPILDDKGKGVKDIFAPAAVKVLDRVDRAEASAYPVLSFDELTRACYPGVNLKGKNKILNQQRAIQAWDELQQRGIIRVIRHADGYQILPSSEHLNLHRAIGRKK